jgi:hypothetical protein
MVGKIELVQTITQNHQLHHFLQGYKTLCKSDRWQLEEAGVTDGNLRKLECTAATTSSIVLCCCPCWRAWMAEKYWGLLLDVFTLLCNPFLKVKKPLSIETQQSDEHQQVREQLWRLQFSDCRTFGARRGILTQIG